ncbi:hypothetical protein MTR67_048899 [Solanum verrucosum]|uniref:Uncharacterized protein n=1 Tax=Solanum verrucosum TaxID=315347 RepID=A0AAF0V1N8_SOLVR|nr:hypothetical protein MTR67_048899 [Solanum verrucosum]
MPDFQEGGNLEVSQLNPSLLEADSNDPYTNFNWKNLPNWINSDGILFNTVEGIDKLGLTYFRRKLGIPAWAIGPIPWPVSNKQRVGNETGEETEKFIKFLDEKEEESVLYISFGSQNRISTSQMLELAKALDNASRVEILAHKSVGAFLTHCGWNSMLESLENGVPLLDWPIAAEQFYNAKFLEQDVGVCVEVARGNNSQVKHDDILKKIEVVMGKNEKGNEIRRKTCEVKEMISDAIIDDEDFKGSSIKAMDEFLNAALSMNKLSNDERINGHS